ncbi:flagellin [bacterium]|nr:flagellin [bacterium]
MSISTVTQFAGALRAQLDLKVGAENFQSATPNSDSEILSRTVSSLDLSNAEYGTLLLKDKLHDQAYAFAVVTVQEQKLSSLNTYINNVQSVADELAATDPSDTIAYAALVEELADREDQLSSFIGAQFHASEFNIGALVDPDLNGGVQNEILNIYDPNLQGSDVIGQIAAIEVNFSKIFETLHNESTCPHCVALAQQNINAGLGEGGQPSYALDANDGSTGSIVDIDGKDTTDTSDARLEPLRMEKQWDFGSASHLDADGDPYLTYSYYDGDTAYPSVYNGSTSGPHSTASTVTSHGAGNEAALNEAFAAWDATADFSFLEVEEDGTEVGELRVAYTDLESGAQAFAYAPGDGFVNGDIWFEQDPVDIAGADDFASDGVDEESSYYSNGTGSKPGYNYFAALHEIGHALGLSHPFDSGDDQTDGTDDDLPLAQDSMRNTVMTYSQLDRNLILKFNTTSRTSIDSYRLWASTPMLYDIEMMEHYYGAEDNDSTGNDTYSFSISPQTIQTITDGGGTDTFDLSNQTRENVIDLTAGSLSSVGIYSVDDQVSDWATALGSTTAAIQSVVDTLDGYASAANSYYSAYSRTALYTGEYNVAIAHNAVIENANGGSANDTITGNSSNNAINGGAGDDLIEGNGGNDTIDGGAGTEDVAVFNDAYANYTITENSGIYTVAHNSGSGADGTDTVTNVEFLEFTDQTIDLSTWPTITTTTTPATSGAQGTSGSGSSYSSSSSSSSSSGTLSSADVSSQAGAKAAIVITDSVLETIANQLAVMGALQNRLTASISSLSSQSLKTEAAIGRIIDTDFSIEMTKLTKSMILSEAANYVLSGAHLSKSNMLKLLN